MASVISDLSAISSSLVKNAFNASTSLDSKKILEWKCTAQGGCSGVWKESVVKRVQFKRCPECEPHATRKAKVQRPSLVDTPKKTTPVSRLTPVPSTSLKVILTREDGSKVDSDDYLKEQGICPPSLSASPPQKVECPICCLVITPRNVCKCPMCEYMCCVACMRTYILGGVDVASCMNMDCAKPFSNVFLVRTLTKKWYIKEYSAHLAKIHTERERALIPATMRLVSAIKSKQEAFEVAKKASVQYHAYVKPLKMLPHLISSILDDPKHAAFIPIYRAREDAGGEYSRWSNLVQNIAADLDYVDVHGSTTQVLQTWIQGCPSEECNGLINSEYVCGACQLELCEKCRRPMNPSHKCLKDDIATTKELAKNTKACPSCAVPVFKIDGCDQMWCTGCKTAFSWTTLRVHKGAVHNPHYYEWLRSTNGTVPRTPGDGCMTLVERHAVDLEQRINFDKDAKQVLGLERYHKLTEMRARIVTNNHGQEQLQIFDRSLHYKLNTERANYIMGKLPEDKWLKTALAAYKESKYERSVLIIEHTLGAVLHDIINPLLVAIQEKSDDIDELYERCWKMAHAAREYFNAVIVEENCELTYDKIRVLNESWEYVSYRSTRKEC